MRFNDLNGGSKGQAMTTQLHADIQFCSLDNVEIVLIRLAAPEMEHSLCINW